MKKIIIVFAASLICFDCAKVPAEDSQGAMVLIENPERIKPELTDLFQEGRFIRLETNEECLLGMVSQLKHYDDKFYVSDVNKICVFDNQGRFLNSIDRYGRGPGEYLGITDFDVTDDKIIIWNGSAKKMITYDHDGEYLKSRDLPDLWSTSFAIVNDSYLVMNARYELPGDKFYVIDIETLEPVRSFYEIEDYKLKYMHFFGENNFSRFEDKLLFNEVQNSLIYEINEMELIPRYNISFGKKDPPKAFLQKSYQDVRDFMTQFIDRGYLSGTSFFFENENNMLFSFSGNGQVSMCIYNKNSKKSSVFTSISLGGKQLDFEEIFLNPGENGKLNIVIPAIALYSDDRNVLSNEFPDMTENDNPVIFTGSLK